jgi:zinc/manganese transport system permease protein
VVTFAGTLLVAATLKVLFFAAPALKLLNRWRLAVAFGTTTLVAVFAQGMWLMIHPAGDQPVLAFVEDKMGLGPELFLSEAERRVFHEAYQTERHHRAEVERLGRLERDARWQGQMLREDELRRASSFQQTYNEMGRGERFVQDHLRALARRRGRWIVGIPITALSTLGFYLLYRASRPKFAVGRSKILV